MTCCNLTWHIFIRSLCGRCFSTEVNFLYLVRCDVAINITVFLYVTLCSLIGQHQYFTESFSSLGQKIKAVGSSVMVPVHQTALRYSWQGSDLSPSSSSVRSPEFPDDHGSSVHTQRPQGDSSSTGMTFCHSCLWTRTFLISDFRRDLNIVYFSSGYFSGVKL